MNYEQFHGQLGRGECQPVYVLVGPEEFFKREAIKLLRKTVLGKADPQLCLLQVDGGEALPADLFDELRTRTFFGTRKLVIVRDAGPFLAEHADALRKYLQRPAPTGVLVLLTEKLDGRTSVAKALAGGVVDCKRLYERQLRGWIIQRARHHRAAIDSDAADLLAAQIGTDLMQLDLQLEKLATLVGGDGRITQTHVAQAVGYDKLVDIFKLTDAVAEGLPGTALEALHRLLETGERPEHLLGMLAWQFRRLRRVRRLLSEGLRGQQLARRVNTPMYFLDSLVRQAQRLSPDDLIHKQGLLHRTDVALKTRSEGNGLRLTEELVVELCR